MISEEPAVNPEALPAASDAERTYSRPVVVFWSTFFLVWMATLGLTVGGLGMGTLIWLRTDSFLVPPFLNEQPMTALYQACFALTFVGMFVARSMRRPEDQ